MHGSFTYYQAGVAKLNTARSFYTAGGRRHTSQSALCMCRSVFFLTLFLTPLISFFLPKDLVVPLFSFTNCFISMILILRSLRHCDIWSKAYHLRPAEILDEYTESSSVMLTYMKCMSVFSQLMQEIEFRIIHDIFCDHYNVQRKAFAFDEYVSLIYERFVLNIIELRLIHWFAFLLVSFAYWIPNSVDHALGDCEEGESETGRCASVQETYLVTLFGALLFFVAVCFAVASRCYEKAIIRMAGKTSDYRSNLMLRLLSCIYHPCLLLLSLSGATVLLLLVDRIACCLISQQLMTILTSLSSCLY